MMLNYRARVETFLRSDIDDRLTALAQARPEWVPCLLVVAQSFGVELDEQKLVGDGADGHSGRMIDVTLRRLEITGRDHGDNANGRVGAAVGSGRRPVR